MNLKIEEELFQIKKKIKYLKTEFKTTEGDLLKRDKASTKLIELEERSRGNNLWVHGIKEETDETWIAYE